jgi:hypothetical protein
MLTDLPEGQTNFDPKAEFMARLDEEFDKEFDLGFFDTVIERWQIKEFMHTAITKALKEQDKEFKKQGWTVAEEVIAQVKEEAVATEHSRIREVVRGMKQTRSNIIHPNYWENMEEFGKMHYNQALKEVEEAIGL